MKKLFTVLSVFLISSAFISADTEFRLLGNINIPVESEFITAAGISAGLDFSPLTVRGRDSVFFSLGGSYSQVPASGDITMHLFDGEAGAGYNCRFMDRLSAGAEGIFGVWGTPAFENKNLPEGKQSFDGESGFLYGGRAFLNFYALPELSTGLSFGYKVYDYSGSPFTSRFEIGLLVKYNFSKGIFGSSAVKQVVTEDDSAGPIFPVFYSRYSDHSFGSMTFINNEKNSIKDVEVSVFIEQFMTNPDVTANFDEIKRGETFTVNLTAFLNENILNTLVASKADAKVIVRYRSLGKLMTAEQSIELTALSRNSMTWEDDRAAAAFISSKDASAQSFARLVKTVVQDSVSSKRPENLQYGAALFGALKAYGLNYVVDPSSAFKENVGTASVDFLKFPYQTLLYRGGDCDDLTILNCALYQALGIETAMITVPGHIFMAFDSGLSEKEAGSISDGIYIVEKGRVWIPVEVTLCQDSFAMERLTGYREWKKFKSERVLIPLQEAWQEYKPVGVPDSDVRIEMPSKDSILSGFRNNVY